MAYAEVFSGQRFLLSIKVSIYLVKKKQKNRDLPTHARRQKKVPLVEGGVQIFCVLRKTCVFFFCPVFGGASIGEVNPRICTKPQGHDFSPLFFGPRPFQNRPLGQNSGFLRSKCSQALQPVKFTGCSPYEGGVVGTLAALVVRITGKFYRLYVPGNNWT